MSDANTTAPNPPSELPSTMRKWTYASTSPSLESHLQLHSTSPLPTPNTKTHHLLRVLAVGLNPVDFKPAESPLLGPLLIRKPATPGFDVCGTIAIPADGSDLEPGTTVYGAASTNPLAGGALAEYITAPTKTLWKLPQGIPVLEAAGVPVAAGTAYASLIPYGVGAGTRVFLNGGSGGVGTYAIQIAKAVGAHVTVSCSGKNAALCRELGADEVLDYTSGTPLVEQLCDVASREGRGFDHVVDNVFSDPGLYWQMHRYSVPSAAFVEVAGGPSVAFMRFAASAFLFPRLLGGGQRKFVVLMVGLDREPMERIGGWIVEGKVKCVTDSVFGMSDLVGAFKKLKTGRAVGKIVVDVAGVGEGEAEGR